MLRLLVILMITGFAGTAWGQYPWPYPYGRPFYNQPGVAGNGMYQNHASDEQVQATSDYSEKHDQALQSMQAGDYAEAYHIWRPYADEGHAEAQYYLGWMYYNGHGLAINDVKALEWWQLAADQQYHEAQFSLGMLYSLGSRTVPRDLKKAIDLFLIAAKGGHRDASQMVTNLILQNDPAIRKLRKELIQNEWPILGRQLSINRKRVNLRSGAGTDFAILKVLEKDVEVVELERQKQWIHIAVIDDGTIGWLFHTLVIDKQAGQVDEKVSETP